MRDVRPCGQRQSVDVRFGAMELDGLIRIRWKRHDAHDIRARLFALECQSWIQAYIVMILCEDDSFLRNDLQYRVDG